MKNFNTNLSPIGATSEPLTFKTHDRLARESFGSTMMDLVRHSDGELVIALDAPWGGGKTTFVSMWQQMLRKNKIPCFCFDAFKADQSEDPFVALVATFATFVNEHGETSHADKLRQMTKKAGVVAAQFLGWSTRLAIKAATLNALDQDQLDELKAIKGDIAADASGMVSSMIAEKISSFDEQLAAIELFKSDLQSMAKTLGGDDSQRVVVIIDELDRCDPRFAIKTLERIKHVLAVPGVVFVLAIHQEQLAAAIRGVYGGEFDAHGYLRKFINFTCRLPKLTGPNGHASCYARAVIGNIAPLREIANLGEYVVSLCDCARLSMRDIEQLAFTLLVFYGRVDPDARMVNPGLVVPLAILRLTQVELYGQLTRGDASHAQVLSALSIPEDCKGNHFLSQSRDMLLGYLLSDQEFSDLPNDSEAVAMVVHPSARILSRERRHEVIPMVCQYLDMEV